MSTDLVVDLLVGVDKKVDEKVITAATKAALVALVPSPNAGMFAVVSVDESQDDKPVLYKSNDGAWEVDVILGGVSNEEIDNAIDGALDDRIGDLTALAAKLRGEGYLT